LSEITEKLIQQMDIRIARDNGDRYSVYCPFHNDSNPSASIYKENDFFVCHAGCGSMHIKKLFYELTGRSANKELGINSGSYLFKQKERIEKSNKFKSFNIEDINVNVNGVFSSINDNLIAQNYCRKRFITDEFINHFNLQYSRFTRINYTIFEDRLVYPIYHNGKLVSIEGRALDPENNPPKTLYPKKASVNTLFNIDNLDRKKPLIIVEGVMDIPKIWLFINKNVTTTFGINISNNQLSLIKEFDEIILFPDGDKGGERFVNILDSKLEREFWVAHLKNADPGDSHITPNDCYEAIENKIKSTEFILNQTRLFEPATTEFPL
jgi:DNA primase